MDATLRANQVSREQRHEANVCAYVDYNVAAAKQHDQKALQVLLIERPREVCASLEPVTQIET
jgi:hypothetical protein